MLLSFIFKFSTKLTSSFSGIVRHLAIEEFLGGKNHDSLNEPSRFKKLSLS